MWFPCKSLLCLTQPMQRRFFCACHFSPGFEHAGFISTTSLKKLQTGKWMQLTIMIIFSFLCKSYKHYAQVFEQAEVRTISGFFIFRLFSPWVANELLYFEKVDFSLHNPVISSDYHRTFSQKKCRMQQSILHFDSQFFPLHGLGGVGVEGLIRQISR